MAQPARTGSPPRTESEEAPFDERAGLFDPFAPLSPSERRRQRAACLELLRRRDGELDVAGLRLSRRERYFASLDRTARWRGPFARAALERALRGGAPGGMDARTVWLYAACRADESESYGVGIEIGRYRRKGTERVPEDQLYVILEEQYHGRILREICRACGVPPVEPRPRWGMRVLIHAFEYLPDPIRYVGVICGEVLGSVVFRVLWENTRLFRSEPRVEAVLRSLAGEILRDELLHVVFCRTRLGSLRLRVARLLMPWIASFLMREVPELASLGCDRDELLKRLRSGLPLPRGLRLARG
jgi:hypothetical protein